MSEEMKTYGQIAYEAYAAASGGKSLVSGQLLPKWDDLDERITGAWMASGRAVDEQVRTDGIDPGDTRLGGILQRLDHLATGLETSARASQPSKKSEIESGCAAAIRDIIGDGQAHDWRKDVVAEVASEMLETLAALAKAGVTLPSQPGALDHWASLLRGIDPVITGVYDELVKPDGAPVTPGDHAPGQRAYEIYTGSLASDGIGCDGWDDLTGPDQAAWAAVESAGAR